MFVAVIALVGCSSEPAAPDSPIRLDEVTVVTDQAALGDYNNAWGGHQARLARTPDGMLYTVYLVDAPGQGANDRAFRLAHKTIDGWEEVGGDTLWGEPPHVLAGPDGTIHVLGYQGAGRMSMWTLAPGSDELVRSELPSGWHDGDPSYSGASIAASGAVYLLASQGGGEPGGLLQWASYDPSGRNWTDVMEIVTEQRYAYAYLLAEDRDGPLGIVAGRDVLWGVLGDNPWFDPNDYAFNAISHWRSPNAGIEPFVRIDIHEEPPTEDHSSPDTYANFNGDAYLDTEGRTHVVYRRRGATTDGDDHLYHAVIENDVIVRHARLDVRDNRGGAMIEDTLGTLYLLTYSQDGGRNDKMSVRTALDDIGTSWSEPVEVDLGGSTIRYSGVTLAAPRTGSQLADYVDGAFPSGDDNEWTHFRIRLR